MGLFDAFRRKKKKEGLQEKGLAELRRTGRITEAVITDVERLDSGDLLVHYHYTVQGANFTSSEILTIEQRKDADKYAPGARVGVRYDPKFHGSSVLV